MAKLNFMKEINNKSRKECVTFSNDFVIFTFFQLIRMSKLIKRNEKLYHDVEGLEVQNKYFITACYHFTVYCKTKFLETLVFP